MTNDRLRIHNNSPRHSHQPPTFASNPQPAPTGTEQVTVPLGQIASALSDAMSSGRLWLEDFETEQVTISRDLFEIILAYQQMRRMAA